jgi:hypothetical protein
MIWRQINKYSLIRIYQYTNIEIYPINKLNFKINIILQDDP